MIERISMFLKLTAIIAVGISLILQICDMRGMLKDNGRLKIISWLLHSNSGMSLELPAARKFMKKFPPPKNEKKENLTHLTKSVVKYESGGILSASVNYMRNDTSRTGHVATIEEIRRWVDETPYRQISWWLSLIGFLGLIGNFILDKKLKKRG